MGTKDNPTGDIRDAVAQISKACSQIARQITQSAHGLQDRKELAEIAARVKERQKEIRRRITEAHVEIRNGVRPIGRKFRL